MFLLNLKLGNKSVEFHNSTQGVLFCIYRIYI